VPSTTILFAGEISQLSPPAWIQPIQNFATEPFKSGDGRSHPEHYWRSWRRALQHASPVQQIPRGTLDRMPACTQSRPRSQVAPAGSGGGSAVCPVVRPQRNPLFVEDLRVTRSRIKAPDAGKLHCTACQEIDGARRAPPTALVEAPKQTRGAVYGS
jgi:hypothetical protein